MRVAIAQIRPKKADYQENVRRIGAVLAQLAGGRKNERPGLVIFGETATTGYFLEGGVREAAVTAGTLYRDLAALHEASELPPVDVCLGFYELFHDRFFNAALYATLGGDDAGIRHVHRKVFLPTYGVFDEERFVDAGRSVQAFDTAWGRVAILVCEDVWHSAAATMAALDGAQLLIVPSASPARGVEPSVSGRINSGDVWERVIRRAAEEHGVYVALASIVGFEGGKGLQGDSLLVGPDGTVLASGPNFEEAIIRGELDHRVLARARADQPLLADLEVALPSLLRARRSPATDGIPPVTYDAPRGPSPAVAKARAGRHPIIEPDGAKNPLAIAPELLEDWLVRFLREEMVVRRGFTKGLVGLSGGVDSAVTAALAARALGSENVVGVWMPYKLSAKESLRHAELVARELNIGLETVDLTAAVDGLLTATPGKTDAHQRGNVIARMRMIVLFDLSAKRNALPLGTGNKTERLLGYFTWHADDAPPVNPLGDLFKTQVWALARHLCIPEEVVSKPATADLIRGQTDEEDLGISYPKADLILHWLVKGFTPEEIVAFGFTAREVATVKSRLDGTHWKRSPPTVAMISSTAIGEGYLRPVDY